MEKEDTVEKEGQYKILLNGKTKTKNKLRKEESIMETLVMPMNYVELQEDEMMYMDGGWTPQQVVKNIVGFAAVTGLAWVANYVKSQIAANPGMGFWQLTGKIGWSVAKGFWALPWWAKLGGFAVTAAVVYALGEWDLF